MIDYHEDTVLFRESLLFTEAETEFDARLIEKDYYCTILLERFQDALVESISDNDGPLLFFKGGTCLSKIHARFCRMSEDLDFSIPVKQDAARSQRSRLVKPFKRMIDSLPKICPAFDIAKELTGHNNSTQYVAEVQYVSAITGQSESIKIEIGTRDPLLDRGPSMFPAWTLLLDPLRKKQAVLPISVLALSCREAYAEKFRAALTRREPAIRDFFDIDYGVREGLFKESDSRLLEFIVKKLSIPGNERIVFGPDSEAILRKQVETNLAPVLRQRDLDDFDLDRAFGIVRRVGERIRELKKESGE